MRRSTSGFTIVELLIVIVVIAILAAISIVAYTGIQQRTRASAVQHDLSQAKAKLMLFKVDNGHFPVSTTELSTVGLPATKSTYDTTANNYYYCLNKVTDQFAIGVRTVGGASSYMISSTSSLEQTASAYADGTCQKVGLTGYADSNATTISGHDATNGWQSWVR